MFTESMMDLFFTLVTNMNLAGACICAYSTIENYIENYTGLGDHCCFSHESSDRSIKFACALHFGQIRVAVPLSS